MGTCRGGAALAEIPIAGDVMIAPKGSLDVKAALEKSLALVPMRRAAGAGCRSLAGSPHSSSVRTHLAERRWLHWRRACPALTRDRLALRGYFFSANSWIVGRVFTRLAATAHPGGPR